MAGFLMVGGRGGALYGQKKIFVIGIVGFALSSLTAGFATSLLVLVISRGIQGVAAAMTTATALAILAATYPEGPKRNKAFGVLVAVLSAGFAAGSILGGVLTAAVGWRSGMFVTVPIGAVAAFLAANPLSILMTASAGGFLLLTVYLQGTLGFSPLYTGLAFLPPAAVFFFVGGWGSSRLVNRLGMKRTLVLSAGLVTLGSALLVPISVETGYLGVLPGSIAWALGASIGFPALAMAGLAGTKPGEEGLASGLIQTSQRLGFPLGLAVLLTVASAFDPLLGLTGFRYAFIGATVLGAVGLGLAILLGRVRVPEVVDEGASLGLEPASDD